MERALPIVAALVTGLCGYLGFRTIGVGTWWWLVGGNLALGVGALAYLKREEILLDTVRLEPGDISRGIAAAALGIGVAVAVGTVALSIVPLRVGEEVLQTLRIRQAVTPEVKRAALVIGAAFAEELVWRGAVTQALAPRFGSKRAPWIASAIGVLALVPTMRPAVILGGIAVSSIGAGLVQRYQGRVAPAMVAHAVLTWVVTEIVVLHFWQKVQTIIGL